MRPLWPGHDDAVPATPAEGPVAPGAEAADHHSRISSRGSEGRCSRPRAAASTT
ncbi:hypothetical protein RB200_16205 [Streptomyces sp. PmtG]